MEDTGDVGFSYLSNETDLKANEGGGPLSFYWERNAQIQKNLGALKIANSGNFKTVNYIQIGQFLTIL